MVKPIHNAIGHFLFFFAVGVLEQSMFVCDVNSEVCDKNGMCRLIVLFLVYIHVS